jgi:putative ABC transport system permease protein
MPLTLLALSFAWMADRFRGFERVVIEQAWRWFRRDLQSPELLWLGIALSLSVAALSSVGFLADRMQRAFEFDARQLLAADLLIAADQPIPARFIEAAKDRKLSIAQTVVFPSMATLGERGKLSSLKAVSSDYPLRGELQISRSTNPQDKDKVNSSNGPAPGNAWVDPALLEVLQAKIGDTLALGQARLRIDAVLLRELDRGAAFMNFAPRVMIALEDLPKTELLGLGSRVTYRLLVAGSNAAVADYQNWVVNAIESDQLRGMRIETLETGQPVMRKTLDRAERFLSLIALLTAMVSAVAIALAARRYVVRQANVCAVMKCLGATQGTILRQQLKTLALLGLLAAACGIAVGWLIQYGLMWFLGNLLLADLPPPSLWPVLWSALLSWFLLLGFAGPPLLTLVQVSPVRLVRRELSGVPVAARWVALLGLLSFAVLLLWAARDWKLASWVGLSFGGAIAVFALLSWIALKLLARSSVSGALSRLGFAGRFALRSQARSPAFAVMQITALAIALMALLIILLLRQDLLKTWQGNVPVDAPNRFVINIQSDQRDALTQDLAVAGLGKPDLYPMVRGRLVEINNRPVMPNDYSKDNARRLVDREFNLSYTMDLPGGNQVVAGNWFKQDKPQISVETGIAKTLGLKLGDRLAFEIAGETVSAEITSLRTLEWGSMRVNFFVIMPPVLLQDLPQSWITAYYQPPNTEVLDFRLTQRYPNITVVDVANSLQQIQDVLNRLGAALGLLFTFTIAAAILVLFAAISATQDERFRDAALLKAVGASSPTLAAIASIELAIVGGLAGLLGGFAAALAAWALGHFVLEIEFNSFASSIAMGVAFGLIACAIAGYQFQRKIQRATAIDCLREA